MTNHSGEIAKLQ